MSDNMDRAFRIMDDQDREIQRLRAENDLLRADLNGLVMLVARKYPGESRYETAARYIREIENAEAAPASDAVIARADKAMGSEG